MTRVLTSQMLSSKVGVILICCGSLVLAVQAQSLVSPKTVETDHRLTATVNYSLGSTNSIVETRQARPLKVTDAVNRIQVLTHANIAIQQSLQDEKLALTCQSAKASTLMDAIAIAIGATWRLDGAVWVLTDVPDVTHIITQDPMNLVLSSQAGKALNNFTPTQLQLLQQKGILRSEELTPVQRRAFAVRAMECYLAYRDGRRCIAPEAFRSEGVFYATHDVDEGVLTGEVGIFFPRTDGLAPSTRGSIPYQNLRQADPNRPIVTKLPTQVPLPLAEAVWKSPLRPVNEAKAFEDDVRLDTPCRAPVGGRADQVWQVLGAITDSSGVDLVAGTALDERKLSLDWGHVSIREALRAIEERTGGRWRVVGNLYALQQDPRVERVAYTPQSLRERRLRETLQKFQSRLSLSSRKALEEGGTLSPAALTQPERTLLVDAAVVAFTVRDNVAARAMELKDVTLKQLPADKARELPRRIRYDLPSTSGPAEAVEISWR